MAARVALAMLLAPPNGSWVGTGGALSGTTFTTDELDEIVDNLIAVGSRRSSPSA